MPRQDESQCFNEEKQEGDKDVLPEPRLPRNHLSHSPDNKGGFAPHCRPLLTYQAAAANASRRPSARTIISGEIPKPGILGRLFDVRAWLI